MQAMKCDRCGKYYEAYGLSDLIDKKEANRITLVSYDYETKYKNVAKERYDLCPECMNTIKQFLKNESLNCDEMSKKREEALRGRELIPLSPETAVFRTVTTMDGTEYTMLNLKEPETKEEKN